MHLRPRGCGVAAGGACRRANSRVRRAGPRAQLAATASRNHGAPLRGPRPSQIEEFIRKQKKSFGAALSVREVAGSYPRLVLTGGGAGSERASIRIDNWKAATIGEYLRDRLKLPADDKKPAAA